MALVNTASLPDLVAQGEIMWRKFRDNLPQEAMTSGIYRVDSFGPGQGDTKQYSEINGEQYAKEKPESAQAVEGRVQQGFSKEMTFRRFSLTHTVSWEMRRRNKYRQIERVWRDVGTTILNRRDLDMQHRITFGTATSYTDLDGKTVNTTTGDGKALFATDHEVKGSSDTYRNLLAGNPALSRGALEGMEKMIVENTIDEFGVKDNGIMYTILYTADDPNTMNTARELLQSTAAISAPNEGVTNVYMGKYRHVKLSRVATDANGNVDNSKAKYWGLCSEEYTPLNIDVEENLTVQSPATGRNTEDILTDDWIYKSTGSYGIVATDGRGIVLSKGNGDA